MTRFILIILISVLSCHSIVWGKESLYNNLPKNNNYFTGRAEELKKIRKELNKRNIIILSGSAGIGKTQIAKAFAHKNINNYNIAFWLDAERSIDEQIINLAKLANKACKIFNEKPIIISKRSIEETIDSLRNRLTNTKLTWILILDNVSDFKRIESLLEIKSKNSNGLTILTTRDNEKDINNISMINIERFTRKDSIEFLNKLEDVEYTEEQLNSLAELLGDHPLALSLAFGYISSATNITIEDYIRLFKSRSAEIMDAEQEILNISKGSYTDNYQRSVKVATLMLKELTKEYSKEAYDFLGVISVLHSKNIPQSLIYTYFKGDEIKASTAIARLLKYSIITRKNKDKGAKEDNIYTIHDLTQKIIQESFQKEDIIKNIEIASSTIRNLIPTERELYIPLIEKEYEILDQIDSLSEISDRYGVSNLDVLSNNIKKLEYTLLERRDFINSIKLIEKIESRFKGSGIEYTIEYSRFLIAKVTYLSWAFSNYTESNKFAYQAEQIIRKKPNSYEAIMLYMRLAQNHEIQGDFDKALEYVEITKKLIQNNKYNSSHHEGIITQSKTKIFIDQGKIEEAYQSVLYELELDNKLSGSTKEINTIPTHCTKAYILTQKGMYEEALKDVRTIRGLINKHFETPYFYSPIPDLIESIIFYKKGEIEVAYKLIKNSLELARKVYPKGNRQMALIYRTLGEILGKKDMHEEALKYFQEAEKIYDEILVNKNIEDVSILYEQIVYNGIATLTPTQCNDYKDKHTEVFGDENKANFRIFKAITMAEDAPYKKN